MTNDQLGNAVFAQGWLESQVDVLNTETPLSAEEVSGLQQYFDVLSKSFDQLYKENAALQEKIQAAQNALI
jgi:hypothetical protein